MDAHELFKMAPVNSFLGYTLKSRSRDLVCISMPVRREFLQETGVVQGGILSALADAAAVYLVLPEAVESDRVAGIELKMNFLLPAYPDRGDLVATSKPLRVGSRLAVAVVDIHQGEILVAHGTFTYLIF